MQAGKMGESSKAVIQSVDDFTTNFHKNVAGKMNDNLVTSALSAHIVLSMAASGAKGSTAEQMRKTLRLSDNEEVVHKGFGEFIDTLNHVPNVTLNVANKIYASDQHTIKEDYKKLVQTHFHSECEAINFSSNVEAASAVNQWCSKKTNDKIKEIIKPDALSSLTTMVLLNAVYFKGLWKHKFDKKLTENKPFHIDKTRTVQVPTMKIKEKFYHQELPEVDAQCIALPYENKEIMLVIILPNEIEGLRKLEDNLEKIQIDYEDAMQYKTEVILELPRFKIESTIELNQHLKEMGMTEMFTDNANFSGMVDKPSKIDKVVQKAFIEVNEEGTEAAAVTGLMMMMCSMPLPPIEIRINRPFLYRIVHKRTTLFSGHVASPKE